MRNIIVLALAALTLGLLWKVNNQLKPVHGEVQIDAAQPAAATSQPAPLETVPVMAAKSADAQIIEEDPQPMNEMDRQLLRVQNLSNIVYPTPGKLQALRKLLRDPALVAEIRRTLREDSKAEGTAFQHKLRVLDALYEGLKFPDEKLSADYLNLTTEILAESFPGDSLGDKEQARLFVADRTEIALTLLKAFPSKAGDIEPRVIQGNEYAAEAFRNAHKLYETYGVAL